MLRLGGDGRTNAVTAATGVAVPLFLDEVATYPGNMGAVVNTISVPSLGGTPCTLASGGRTTTVPYMWYDTDGFISTSGDGTLALFPCYAVQEGTVIAGYSNVTKAIALIRASGNVDLSTTFTTPYGGTKTTTTEYHFSMHNAATQDGNLLYLASGCGYFTSNGLYCGYFVFRGPGTVGAGQPGVWISGAVGTNVSGYDDGRCVGMWNSKLYGSDGRFDRFWQGLFSFGNTLPTGNVAASQLFIGSTLSPWTFAFVRSFRSRSRV